MKETPATQHLNQIHPERTLPTPDILLCESDYGRGFETSSHEKAKQYNGIIGWSEDQVLAIRAEMRTSIATQERTRILSLLATMGVSQNILSHISADPDVADYCPEITIGENQWVVTIDGWLEMTDPKQPHAFMTDDDGYGHPSNGTRMDTRFRILPSAFTTNLPASATHIVIIRPQKP